MTVEQRMIGPSPVLLTTCHVQNDGTADLLNLISSAEAALRDGEVGGLRHIILLQSCTSSQCCDFKHQLPDWVELLSTGETLSSPSARNLMIRYLLGKEGFDPSTFVGFPDDDAWYPSGALACVARHFRCRADLQLLLGRYGPLPSANQCGKAFRPTLQQALSRGACAAIFVRASMVAQLGGFHELLGLGTILCGGEDTEFVHRAFQRANGRVACVPGFLVGHAASDPAKKAKYYEGGLTALMAHRDTSTAARIALVRKTAVGLWMVLRKRMSLSQYFLALRRARANAKAVRDAPLPYQAVCSTKARDH